MDKRGKHANALPFVDMPVEKIAAKLKYHPKYIRQALGGSVWPKDTLAVALCQLNPRVERWMLRPDLWAKPELKGVK